MDVRLYRQRIVSKIFGWSRPAWAAAVIASQILFAASVSAQQKRVSDQRVYDEAVAEGVAEFSRGNFAEARALFQRAHQVQPNARTLRSIGMCAFEMREYVDAFRLFDRALRERRKELDAELREEVEALMARSLAFIGRYRVETVPADAGLLVDGAPTELDQGQLLLGLGKHQLVARAPGYGEIVRQLHVRGGERKHLLLELSPLSESRDTADESPATGTEGEAKAAASEAKLPQDAESGFASGRVWTWVALGGAGAFGGAALLLWLRGQGQYDDLMGTCTQGCSDEQIEREIEDSGVETSQLLTNVSLGLSGACLAGAALLFFLEGQTESGPTALTAGIGPGAVRIAGRF